MRASFILIFALASMVSLCSGVPRVRPRAHLKQGFINPTGTYRLTGRVKKNRVISHSGEMRVNLLQSGKIAVAFYINKGFPNYEAAAIMDTLMYKEDLARYTPACDSSCTLIFWFSSTSMELQELYTNPRSSCGFATGVLTGAIFEKISRDPPIIQDLSARGRL